MCKPYANLFITSQQSFTATDNSSRDLRGGGKIGRAPRISYGHFCG